MQKDDLVIIIEARFCSKKSENHTFEKGTCVSEDKAALTMSTSAHEIAEKEPGAVSGGISLAVLPIFPQMPKEQCLNLCFLAITVNANMWWVEPLSGRHTAGLSHFWLNDCGREIRSALRQTGQTAKQP
jgi:hypothetical protein